jgi:tryptophan synthase alpha subunit
VTAPANSRGAAVAFEKARADGRAALVGYLPAGFPTVAGGIAALRAMVDAGCDVIEVGLPYSDPVMDGPTIQRAAQEALALARPSRRHAPMSAPPWSATCRPATPRWTAASRR